MASSKKVLDELVIQRAYPKNFSPADHKLFDNSLSGKARAVFIHELNKVTVNAELYLKNLFGFKILDESFGDYWQIEIYNQPLRLLKSFIKDRIRSRRKIENALWCFDTFSVGGYYHWITEICPKLWIASQHLDRSIPVLVPSSMLKKFSFGIEFLKEFDREIIVFEPNELPTIHKLFVIGQPGGPLNFQPKSIISSSFFIKQKFSQNLSPTSLIHPLIYISRNKVKKRTLRNEDEIIPWLKERGFQIVYAEDFSLSEQFFIFSNAKVLVSIHGAGLSNLVFMQQGSSVVEIRSKEEDHMINCFYTLAHTFQLQYFYQLAEMTPLDSELKGRSLDMSLTIHVPSFKALIESTLKNI